MCTLMETIRYFKLQLNEESITLYVLLSLKHVLEHFQ